jgi:hypothetical protein
VIESTGPVAETVSQASALGPIRTPLQVAGTPSFQIVMEDVGALEELDPEPVEFFEGLAGFLSPHAETKDRKMAKLNATIRFIFHSV